MQVRKSPTLPTTLKGHQLSLWVPYKYNKPPPLPPADPQVRDTIHLGYNGVFVVLAGTVVRCQAGGCGVPAQVQGVVLVQQVKAAHVPLEPRGDPSLINPTGQDRLNMSADNQTVMSVRLLPSYHLTLPMLRGYFCPKHTDEKIFEKHLNPVMLVCIR